MFLDVSFSGTTQAGSAGSTSGVVDASNLSNAWPATLGQWIDATGNSWRVIYGVLTGVPGSDRPSVLVRPPVEALGNDPTNHAFNGWRTKGAVVADSPVTGWPSGDSAAWGIVVGFTSTADPYWLVELRSSGCSSRPSTLGISRISGATSTPLPHFMYGSADSPVAWTNDPTHQYRIEVEFSLFIDDLAGPSPAYLGVNAMVTDQTTGSLSASISGRDDSPSTGQAYYNSLPITPGRAGLACPVGSSYAKFSRVRLGLDREFATAGGGLVGISI